MEKLIEVRLGRQTSRSVVQGPFPSAFVAAEQLAGKAGLAGLGVTETEVLTRVGLRSLICRENCEISVKWGNKNKTSQSPFGKAKDNCKQQCFQHQFFKAKYKLLTPRCQVPAGMRAMLFCVMVGTVRT